MMSLMGLRMTAYDEEWIQVQEDEDGLFIFSTSEELGGMSFGLDCEHLDDLIEVLTAVRKNKKDRDMFKAFKKVMI